MTPITSNNFIITKEERRREYMQRVERFVLAYEGVKPKKKKKKERRRGAWDDYEVVKGIKFMIKLLGF